VQAQVAALGGQWHPAIVAPGDYGHAFGTALQQLRQAGHTHMVFGDIDLQAHSDWLEPMCDRAGLQAVFPLWGEPRAALAGEILRRGIRARIVCVDKARLDASFCGAEYDAALLARLPPGVCPCGEDGEFHTFVWGGPGFAAPLKLGPGKARVEPSRPPLSPTELVFQSPELLP
jgi:diphthamide synthase (EF-2-diphthine--ammonia ligase)